MWLYSKEEALVATIFFHLKLMLHDYVARVSAKLQSLGEHLVRCSAVTGVQYSIYSALFQLYLTTQIFSIDTFFRRGWLG
jgi:hypothetical protein